MVVKIRGVRDRRAVGTLARCRRLRQTAEVTVEHDDDVVALRRVGAVVAEARDAMLAAAQPGIATAELDAIGRDVLRQHGARSAPRLAYGFPGSCCIGINDRVAHGIPSPA